MPAVVKTELGKITIADDIIATIAGHAAIENIGVIGMASKRAGDGLWELIKKENLKRGVKVAVKDAAVTIDLYVMVEYGVSIAAVARNVIDSVTYRVSELTQLEIASVNTHIEGVRVNED